MLRRLREIQVSAIACEYRGLGRGWVSWVSLLGWSMLMGAACCCLYISGALSKLIIDPNMGFRNFPRLNLCKIDDDQLNGNKN